MLIEQRGTYSAPADGRRGEDGDPNPQTPAEMTQPIKGPFKFRILKKKKSVGQ